MKQKRQFKRIIRSLKNLIINKIPIEHSTLDLEKKAKSLLRRLEIGELTDEDINSLDKELKRLFVKKIMEINEQKLEQNPEGNEKANKKLLKSAEEGSITGILYSLLKGANINARGDRRWSILHLADFKNNLNIIKFLAKDEYLRDKIDWNARSTSGRTFLHSLFLNNSKRKLIKFLAKDEYLRDKIDWNAKDDEGWTFLYLLAYNNHLSTVKFFFKNKENFELIRDSVYSVDIEGHTILDISKDKVKTYLIKIGYNPFIGKVDGLKEYKETYKELLEKIKTIEDAKKIAKENNFNEDVFILGISLYFAENCDNNFINFIS